MKKLVTVLAAGAMACAAMADGEAESSEGLAFNMGEGITFNDQQIMSVEFGLALDSKYMSYGVVDGKDPILTPNATATFFDWLYFDVSAIFDMTKGNGKRGGYGNRAGKWTTLDATVGLAHEFDIGDDLTLGFDFNYIYEYMERCRDYDNGGDQMNDTQYLNLELSLGGLWLEPTLAIERDLMADDGTYVNFSLAHEFALIEGEDEDADPVLSITPSIAQGFGNTQRVYGYFGECGPRGEDGYFNHGGIMDTTFQIDLTWNVTDGFSLGAYVAYYDYLFDSNMRDAAREYNAAWGKSEDHSWNFVGGLSATLTF